MKKRLLALLASLGLVFGLSACDYNINFKVISEDEYQITMEFGGSVDDLIDFTLAEQGQSLEDYTEEEIAQLKEMLQVEMEDYFNCDELSAQMQNTPGMNVEVEDKSTDSEFRCAVTMTPSGESAADDEFIVTHVDDTWTMTIPKSENGDTVLFADSAMLESMKDIAPDLSFDITMPEPITNVEAGSAETTVDGNTVKIGMYTLDPTVDIVVTAEKPETNQPAGNDGGNKETDAAGAHEGGLSLPVIIGIIAGGVILLAIVAALVVYFVRKNKKNKAPAPEGGVPQAPFTVQQTFAPQPPAAPGAPFEQPPAAPTTPQQ